MQAWKGRESTGSLGDSRPLSSKPGKSGTSGLACLRTLWPHACSPLLPALAHADAAPVAGSRVAATSLADLESDPTGRAAQGPRGPRGPRPIPGGVRGDRGR